MACNTYPAKIPESDIPVIPEDTLTTDVVTEGCVDGNGIYDEFMKAHLDAIHQEYAKNRIKGSEYSQVYLGGMQAAMSQAVQFALGKDQAAAQAELARYQILKTIGEVSLVEKQNCKIDQEILLIQEQVKLTKAQTDLAEKELELKQAQREMTAAQTWAEIAKTDPNIDNRMDELLHKNYSGPDELKANSALFEQILKTKREGFLLRGKERTEQAQTLEKVEYLDLQGIPYLPSYSAEGVVRKEKNLLQRQSDGFLRDAESKVAKMATDAFAVQFSTLDGFAENTNMGNFSLANLSAMLGTAYANSDNAEHATDDVNDKS